MIELHHTSASFRLYRTRKNNTLMFVSIPSVHWSVLFVVRKNIFRESQGLEGKSRDYIIQQCAKAGFYTRLHRKASRLILNISSKEDSPQKNLASLFHSSVTITVKISLCSSGTSCIPVFAHLFLILSLGTILKNLVPSFWLLSIQYL